MKKLLGKIVTITSKTSKKGLEYNLVKFKTDDGIINTYFDWNLQAKSSGKNNMLVDGKNIKAIYPYNTTIPLETFIKD